MERAGIRPFAVLRDEKQLCFFLHDGVQYTDDVGQRMHAGLRHRQPVCFFALDHLRHADEARQHMNEPLRRQRGARRRRFDHRRDVHGPCRCRFACRRGAERALLHQRDSDVQFPDSHVRFPDFNVLVPARDSVTRQRRDSHAPHMTRLIE